MRSTLVILGCCLLTVPTPTQAAEPPRPNVLVILADYMGYNDTEPYGAEDVRTPHLTRLAREGVRFTDAYSSAPICSPSRAGLLTGRYQQRFGMEENVVAESGLPRSEVTLAQVLQDDGYATAMVGKWHLGSGSESGPNVHGFGESLAFHDWSIDYYSHRTMQGAPGLYENGRQVDIEGYATDVFTDRAISFIDRHADSPFFVYLAFNATLPPYQVPGRPEDVRAPGPTPVPYVDWSRGSREDYVGVVEALDAGIGRVLAALDRLSLADDTIVVFAYDHGGSGLTRHDPLSGGFGELQEGGIRVPMILRWPGRLPAGKVSSQQASLLDLMPTILAATGSQPPPGRELDGIDLTPILDGSVPERERSLYWRSSFRSPGQKAVRRGRWKLFESEGVSLFDLSSDVSEQTDVSDLHPGVVEGLSRELSNWESELARSSAAVR